VDKVTRKEIENWIGDGKDFDVVDVLCEVVNEEYDLGELFNNIKDYSEEGA
tara:strand:- start:270 stop:422 length:153 start_codon:yes stop_codon:yes gene_type:complete